ncbi:MAG: dihydroorotate dehydrogenase electron transfer subunit [Kiritimatiellaeota bacterium]|nr:dihydroorotate dehydrogenase electron transfer subunit [Kiritimatiellota bacterium]
MELRCPAVCAVAEPGQFVHVRIPALRPGALRRPLSLCKVEGDTLTLLYKIVGEGTEALARMKAGETVNLLGPLGNGFPMEGLKVEGGKVEGADDTSTASRLRPSTFDLRPILVGGGYGVAPLLFLAMRLKRKGAVFMGGRTKEDIMLTEEFAALGWDVRLATEDGSVGTKGYVTDAIEEWSVVSGQWSEVVFYACGPDGMLRAVGELAQKMDCAAWLSLDKHMGCGVGACLACIQTLRKPDGTEWIGRVCKDGPVFEAREIVW